MFDLFKKDTDSQNGFVAYEEIDSKKTSKLGYFFLLLMVIFGVYQGQNLLGAIQNTIDKPVQNSHCSAYLKKYLTQNINNNNINFYYDYNQSYKYEYYNDYSITSYDKCSFSDREQIVGISELYKEVSSDLTIVQSLTKDLNSIKQQKSNIQYNRSNTIDEYSVSLLESIAQKNQVLNITSLRGSIKNSDDLIKFLTVTENNLQGKINNFEQEIRSKVLQYKDDFKKIEYDYKQDKNIYELKQFGLSLLFILPVFLFVWRRYFISKNRRSEYAIIWSGILAISALMLAQILLVFVYHILPHQLLQKIFIFLSNFKFFFTILYWLGFIIVPLFFGGLIYFIQKKFYNKKAIVARAFKASKCPTCSMGVARHMIFCPVCATVLKVKCNSCGNYSPEVGNFCEICGVKKL